MNKDILSTIQNIPQFEIPEIKINPQIFNTEILYVAVLGNGFDIDLGMKTTYKNFAESNDWPFKGLIKDEDTLRGFLNGKKDIEQWFDIEEALAEYAKSEGAGANIETDEKDLQILKKSLKKYLERQQNEEEWVKKNSRAKLILAFLSHVKNYYIYTFNYTDVVAIAQKMGIEIEPERVKYIHGSLADDDMILGVGEKHVIPSKFNWLYKITDARYHSNDLFEKLVAADEVILFGHSLGENDFDYFVDYMESAKEERKPVALSENYRRKLMVYTSDEKARMGLCMQFRKMTSNHVTALYSHTDVEIKKIEDEMEIPFHPKDPRKKSI